MFRVQLDDELIGAVVTVVRRTGVGSVVRQPRSDRQVASCESTPKDFVLSCSSLTITFKEPDLPPRGLLSTVGRFRSAHWSGQRCGRLAEF